MNYQNADCLILALSWCNPSDGLDYSEYIDQILRSIDNGFIDRERFIYQLKAAVGQHDFDWSGLLTWAKSLNLVDYAEILNSQLESRNFALGFLMPVLERLCEDTMSAFALGSPPP